MTTQVKLQQSHQPEPIHRTCALHENQPCIFLCTDPDRNDSCFKCDFCVVDQVILPQYLIPISQIQKATNKTVFWHWPLFDDSGLIRKVKSLSVEQKTDMKYKENIDAYFKELRFKVLSRITEIHEKMKTKAKELWEFDERIFEQYNALCAKQALKNIIFDDSMEINQLSLRVKEIISGVQSHKEATKVALQASLDQMTILESAIDFEGPKKIEEAVLSSLSTITMFLVDDMRDLILKHEQNQRIVDQMNQQESDNLNAVLCLASSRLNNTSEEFKEKLKQQLSKYSKLINKVNLGDVKKETKRVNELELLDEGEIEEIQRFVDVILKSKKKESHKANMKQLTASDIIELIKCKANHVSDGMISQSTKMLEGISRYIASFTVDSVRKEGFEQESFNGLSDYEIKKGAQVMQNLKELLTGHKNDQECLSEVIGVGQQIINSRKKLSNQKEINHLSVDKIIELIKNQTNFCTDVFLKKVDSSLKGMKHYIESFEVGEQGNWRGLGEEQMRYLGKLSEKMRDLSQKYGDNYINRITPLREQQINSAIACERIKQKTFLNQNEQQNIELLLCKLPVLEMIQQFNFTKSIQQKWVLPSFKQSNKLQIVDQNNDNLGVTIVQKTNFDGSCVTQNDLENNLVYSLKCTLNKPMRKNSSDFYFGLIPSERINHDWVGENDWNSVFCTSHSDFQIIKGKLLNESSIYCSLTEINFKFCIERQAFYFSDKGNVNINKIKRDKIKPAQKYRFGVSFYEPGNDYTYKFSDVKVMKDQSMVDMF